MILQTDRLYLREMEQTDFDALCKILQDPKVMYAYEHAFSEEEVQQWLDRQRARYRDYGFGLWAVIEKASGEMIGQCGLTMQDCGGREVLEVGYLFRRAYWHRGFATEAAIACKEYAFQKLHAKEVYSIIRDSNIASQNVAIRNGMTICGTFIKHYYGMDMPHLLFSVRRAEKKTSPLRLRPYKNCDAKYVVSWIKDERSFRRWCADRYEKYPISAEDINRQYAACQDADNFYAMTAFDESGVVGHLIMRFTDEEKTVLRFGFVIVDDAKRGRGYGKEMLTLALKYAFEILKVKKVTLGVFENNEPAYHCYKSVGFRDVPLKESEVYHILDEDWKCLEMQIEK